MSQSITITLPHSKFDAAITNSKRGDLGKRGITGGIEVDFSQIPENILWELLIQATTAHLQEGLKKVDKKTATTEECQAAMTARLELLKAGALSETTKAKGGARNTLRDAAKTIMRRVIRSSTKAKLDAATVKATVDTLFKLHTACKKAMAAGDDSFQLDGEEFTVEEATPQFDLVEQALATAEQEAKEREQLAGSLGDIVAAAKAASAKAQAAAAANPEAAKKKPAKGKGKAAAR